VAVSAAKWSIAGVEDGSESFHPNQDGLRAYFDQMSIQPLDHSSLQPRLEKNKLLTVLETKSDLEADMGWI